MKIITKLILSILSVILPERNLKIFHEYYLTDEDIRLNDKIVASMKEIKDLKSVSWFIPKIGNINAGGIATILKIAEYLTKKNRCKNYFIFSDGDLNTYRQEIFLLYPDLDFEIILCGLDKKEIDNLPKANVGICTFWTTAFSLAKYNKCDKKFYLLQDDERCFYEFGATRELVESTYRMGFKGIANSDYIYRMYKDYSGTESLRYLAGVNDYYCCNKKDYIGCDKINIVVYCRPSHSRNCFEILILAVKRVAEELKDKVIFHLVGEEGISRRRYKLPQNCIIYGNIGDQVRLKKIYSECVYGISFISTPTISYHQLDLIQSKVCLITNKNMEIEHIFTPDEVLYSEATPNALASLLFNLVKNKHDAEKLTDMASNKIKIFNWDLCLKNIENFIRIG